MQVEALAAEGLREQRELEEAFQGTAGLSDGAGDWCHFVPSRVAGANSLKSSLYDEAMIFVAELVAFKC